MRPAPPRAVGRRRKRRPGETCSRLDADLDGYGNACDADYNGNFLVTTPDFGTFLDQFLGTQPLGPGLFCAGVTDPCLP